MIEEDIDFRQDQSNDMINQGPAEMPIPKINKGLWSCLRGKLKKQRVVSMAEPPAQNATIAELPQGDLITDRAHGEPTSKQVVRDLKLIDSRDEEDQKA